MANSKVESNTTFTTPITWVVDQLVTESDLNNEIRDNVNALLTPAYGLAILDDSADITIASGGAFADLDSTGTQFTLSVTTAGGPVLIGFSGSVTTAATASQVFFDVTVDGTRIGGDDGLFLVQIKIGSIAYAPVNFTTIHVPAAGSHTFVVQAKATSGASTFLTGAGTSGGDIHPRFFVIEM